MKHIALAVFAGARPAVQSPCHLKPRPSRVSSNLLTTPQASSLVDHVRSRLRLRLPPLPPVVLASLHRRWW